MIKDSAKGLFDVIIVWKLDRFARNRYDSAHYKAQLRKYGVKVLSATENISDGPEGIILESMLEGMAEYYPPSCPRKSSGAIRRMPLKVQVQRRYADFRLYHRQEICSIRSTHTPPLLCWKCSPCTPRAPTMKEIVAYTERTRRYHGAGQENRPEFYGPPAEKTGSISGNTVTAISSPRRIPAIVPQDLFDRVQQRLEVNRKAPARHKAEDDYLLTTKLFLRHLGAMMVGESGTSASKGRKYHYYRCVNTKKNKTCSAKHKSVRKLPLETPW